MHGLGASGHDFEPVVPMMQMPQLRFVFPHAPRRAVTISGGLQMPAWYDILTLERTGLRENRDHVMESAEQIRALIEREEARGVPCDRIVLAGFSQGGAIALYTALRHPKPLAGILVISGAPVLADRLIEEAHEANRSTPILFCHGTYDPIIPVKFARMSHDLVAGWSKAEVEFSEYPIEHRVSDTELARIGTWLRERFPADH